MKLKHIVFNAIIIIFIIAVILIEVKIHKNNLVSQSNAELSLNENEISEIILSNTTKQTQDSSFAEYENSFSFNIKGNNYTIYDFGCLPNEVTRLEGSFVLDKNKILFFYDGLLSRNTNMGIFDIKNNSFEEIQNAKAKHNNDYTNAIKLNNNKILLSGRRTAIFNPGTKRIIENDDWITGRDFHTVMKDNNTVLRFLPDSKNICYGYPGGCHSSEEYIKVLATDLKTGECKEINKLKIKKYDRQHITLDNNRVLSYTTDFACGHPDMNLYIYNISENKFTFMKEIKNIGYSYAITAQKLNNGYILFTGSTNQCTKEYDSGDKQYIDSVIYDPDKNKIVKKVKMLFKPLGSFFSVRLVPLKTGDMLVLEEGHIRQYFDISDMSFKKLDKELVLNTKGGENIAVLDKNTIIISHGYTVSEKHAGRNNSNQIYVLQSGNRKLNHKIPVLKIPKNNEEKTIKNLPKEKVHVVAVYKSQNGDTGNHKEGIVNIYVKKLKKDFNTLLLSSYEPVVWKINDPDKKIKKIYISSYYENRVEGTEAPVEKLKERISLDENTFYKVEEIFAKQAETYQYKYSGSHFFIDGEKGKDFKKFKKHQTIGKKDPVLFTNNSLIAVYNGFGASTTVYANKYVTKGKYYFEMQLKLGPNAHTTFNNAGIMSDSSSHGYCNFSYPLDEGKCFYASLGNHHKLKNNDIVGIAFDMDNGYLFYSINGIWNEEGVKFRNDGREYCPAAEIMEGGRWYANFGAKKFYYSIPKGYKAFSKY